MVLKEQRNSDTEDPQQISRKTDADNVLYIKKKSHLAFGRLSSRMKKIFSVLSNLVQQKTSSSNLKQFYELSVTWTEKPVRFYV